MEKTQDKAARLLKTKIELTRNDHARAAGIPKAFRQNSKRYGAGLHAMIQDHQKYRHAMMVDDKGFTDQVAITL